MNTTAADRNAEHAMQRTSALAFLLERLDVWSVDDLNRVSISKLGGVDIHVRTPEAFRTALAELFGPDHPVTTVGQPPSDKYGGLLAFGVLDGIDVCISAYWAKAQVTA